MIEIKSYTYEEIAAEMKTNDIQGIKRKLNSADIVYSVSGQGKGAVFEITGFENEFKVFCELELGFAPQTDFDKLKWLVMYLFNNKDDFCSKTQEEQCRLLAEQCSISRPTVSKYVKRFKSNGYIHKAKTDCKYYAVNCGVKTEIEQEKYSAAWCAYFDELGKGNSKDKAIAAMKAIAGGWAVKVPIIIKNAFYLDKIMHLLDLAIAEIEKESRD